MHRQEFISVVAGGSTVPPDDYGIVAVIDGRMLRVSCVNGVQANGVVGCLKLTPLRLTNVPPPMALFEIDLPHNAVDVAISRPEHSESTLRIAVLHNQGVSCYNWDLATKPITSPTLIGHADIPSEDAPPEMQLQQVCWMKSQCTIIVHSYPCGSAVKAVDLLDQGIRFSPDLSFNDTGFRRIVPLTSSKRRQALCMLLESQEVVVTHRAGNIPDDEKYLVGETVSTPWVEVVELPAGKDSARQDDEIESSTYIAFGLSVNGSLYANQRLLVRGCTSFLVTASYLIFTTTQHLLKFVHLAAVEGMKFKIPSKTRSSLMISLDLEVPPDTPETDERCRSVERGARLVTAMPTAFAVVLQMPRGNLETVYPRALVLAGIRESIAAKKYKKAFLACRNHRVDLNILHDHDPQQFMSSVGLFVDQIEKVEYIDLFLSQLRYSYSTLSAYLH